MAVARLYSGFGGASRLSCERIFSILRANAGEMGCKLTFKNCQAMKRTEGNFWMGSIRCSKRKRMAIIAKRLRRNKRLGLRWFRAERV